MGKTVAMTVVMKAEFAQSYITHARSSGRSRPYRPRSDSREVGGGMASRAYRIGRPVTMRASLPAPSAFLLAADPGARLPHLRHRLRCDSVDLIEITKLRLILVADRHVQGERRPLLIADASAR